MNFCKLYFKVFVIAIPTLVSWKTAMSQVKYFKVSGEIKDALTKEPLSRANVTIVGKPIGTTSNSAGGFEFHIPTIYSNDTLAISFIGYKTFKIRLTDLKEQSILKIAMEQSGLQLNEVIVNADKSKIDKKDLKRFVKILTSDSLEGRGTGTEGQRKAERFISERFKELGLNAYDQNGYLQRFKLNQMYLGEVYIKAQNRVLKNFENMVFQGSNAQNDETEKEVVFGGLGTEKELNQIEVKDRFVLVFVKNVRGNYDLNTRLSQRKASGVILANPENEKQFELIRSTYKDFALQKRLSLPTSNTIQSPLAQWDTIRFINAITIPNSEIKNICGLSPRALTKLIKENRIKGVPVAKIKIKFERIQKEIETANAIGVIKGKSNKAIVVSAHYDHLGKSGKEYFPGADDNASGTAALLEIAEEFSKSKNLEYSIVFLATSAEEGGLLGSLYHVNHPDFDAQNILCNLNLDMISRTDDKHDHKKYLYCSGTDQSTEMENLIRKADRLYDKCSFDYSLNNSKDPFGLFARSDSFSFYKKGILAIHFFSGFHLDYHKTTDTVDKIDFENLQNRVRQISLVISLLQSEGMKN